MASPTTCRVGRSSKVVAQGPKEKQPEHHEGLDGVYEDGSRGPLHRMTIGENHSKDLSQYMGEVTRGHLGAMNIEQPPYTNVRLYVPSYL